MNTTIQNIVGDTTPQENHILQQISFMSDEQQRTAHKYYSERLDNEATLWISLIEFSWKVKRAWFSHKLNR